MTTSTAPFDHDVDLHARQTWQASLFAVLIFGVSTILVAALGGAATSSSVDSEWFRTLDKPSWYPPSAAFGIVWTVLYAMIAASGWLAWRAGVEPKGLVLWGVQLALNLAWSVVFFGLRAPAAAMVVIVALALSIAATIALFARRSRLAAGLLVPYLAWVLFASALNASIALSS